MGWVYREGLDEGSERGHFAESLAGQLCGLARGVENATWVGNLTIENPNNRLQTNWG